MLSIIQMDMLFQSTPPARGATSAYYNSPWLPTYFNPRPPRGGRLDRVATFGIADIRFQSTPPARGATLGWPGLFSFISISIHAPREGGDF